MYSKRICIRMSKSKPARQPADRPLRVSEDTHRALVEMQLKAVQRGEPRPTLDQVIAKLIKK